MILGVAFLAVLATVPLRGGRLADLSSIRLRAAWSIVVSLALQTLVISIIAGSVPFAVASAVHLLSYALTLYFVLRNWHVPGIAVVVLGGVLNLIAITANDGVMPASAWALEFAGKADGGEEFVNSMVQDDARLVFLGDVFAIPASVPLANVFSIGDVLLVVGGAVVVHRACRPRTADELATELTGSDPVVGGRLPPLGSLVGLDRLPPSRLSPSYGCSGDPVPVPPAAVVGDVVAGGATGAAPVFGAPPSGPGSGSEVVGPVRTPLFGAATRATSYPPSPSVSPVSSVAPSTRRAINVPSP